MLNQYDTVKGFLMLLVLFGLFEIYEITHSLGFYNFRYNEGNFKGFGFCNKGNMELPMQVSMPCYNDGNLKKVLSYCNNHVS